MPKTPPVPPPPPPPVPKSTTKTTITTTPSTASTPVSTNKSTSKGPPTKQTPPLPFVVKKKNIATPPPPPPAPRPPPPPPPRPPSTLTSSSSTPIPSTPNRQTGQERTPNENDVIPETPQPPEPMMTPTITRYTGVTTPTPSSNMTTPLQEMTPRDDGNLNFHSNQPTPINNNNNNNNISSIHPETPNTVGRRSTIVTPQKPLIFLTDQTTVPTGLKKLHDSTRHRRRQMMTQIHNLDCQMASLTANFAEETMDLDLGLRDTLDRVVCIPLESSVNRLVMERESSEQRGPAIRRLERQLAVMDSQMTLHTHVDCLMAEREHLDSLSQEFHQEVIPRLRMEDTKSEKIEGGVIRRFENIAGIVTRQFHQEVASRRASVELVRQKYHPTNDDHTKHDFSGGTLSGSAPDATMTTTTTTTLRGQEDLLDDIKALREQLKKEREQRRREDMIIMDDIRRTTVAMKRALLAVVGGT